MKRLTKVDRVEALIDALEIDENIIKEHIIKKIWVTPTAFANGAGYQTKKTKLNVTKVINKEIVK